MKQKLKILALSGSTRKNSSNLQLIRAFQQLSKDYFDILIYQDLLTIPAFNPDDADVLPSSVIDLKKKIQEADAVLICTPEYAAGVPGSLKNAIDWTVSGTIFTGKPIALITAGTSGYLAHASLLGTLLIIGSSITKESQLVIPSIKTKLIDDKISDEKTLTEVQVLINSLKEIVLRPDEQTFLPPPAMK
jgi:chromate reductase, NAD(P)H dehydrogenase (quinone)